jgi:hypothetical protein
MQALPSASTTTSDKLLLAILSHSRGRGVTNRAQEQGGAHAVMPQRQIFRWLPTENDTHDGLVCDAQTVLPREGIMNERGSYFI